MTSMKAEDLAGFVGKIVVVQVDVKPISDDDDTFREVTGKCMAATLDGLVIQQKSTVELIKMMDILDVEVVTLKRTTRLVRRYVEVVTDSTARQHLLDRHGLPFEVVRSLTPTDGVMFHSAVKHDALGHGHGAKPPGKPGRPMSIKRVVRGSES